MIYLKLSAITTGMSTIVKDSIIETIPTRKGTVAEIS
jgi:hypothetical protein